MKTGGWIITLVIVGLVVFVLFFTDLFIVEENELVDYDFCEVREDCVYAVMPSSCCNCPIPLNKDVVELEDDYVFYVEGEDYSLYEKEEDCWGVACSPCAPLGDIQCNENKCYPDLS